MVQRLESKVYAARTNQEPVIDFEKNDDLKGLDHIDALYRAIINRRPLELCYQSFKARHAHVFHFHAYYLKEYRNRWFVLGVKQRNTPILTLALDRIVSIAEAKIAYVARGNFSLPGYLHDVIGVTVSQNAKAEAVLFKADRETAPYIITKPLHHSQQVVEQGADGIVVSLQVQLNFELEREILGFGDRIKVLSPERLKRRIRAVLTGALAQYSEG